MAKNLIVNKYGLSFSPNKLLIPALSSDFFFSSRAPTQYIANNNNKKYGIVQVQLKCVSRKSLSIYHFGPKNVPIPLYTVTWDDRINASIKRFVAINYNIGISKMEHTQFIHFIFSSSPVISRQIDQIKPNIIYDHRLYSRILLFVLRHNHLAYYYVEWATSYDDAICLRFKE